MDRATNGVLRALGRRLSEIYEEVYSGILSREEPALKQLAEFDAERDVNEGNILAAWLAYVRLVDRKTGFVNRIASEVASAGKSAVRIIEEARLDVFEASEKWSLDSIARQIGADVSWAGHGREALRAALSGDAQLFERLGAREAYDRGRRQYVRERAYGRLGSDKLIVRRLQGQLAQATSAGESIPQIAARIRAVTQMSYRQAVTVARTEMMKAANQGRMAGLKQARVEYNAELQKRWISTHDARTRPDHAEMGGVTIELEEPFIMPDGSKMMHPGDPSGPAEQIINCRCTVIGVLKGFSFS